MSILHTGAQAMRIVTTSWDDGHRSDLKIAKLLHERMISGTFYIPSNEVTRSALLGAELRGLISTGFEIGAHTVSHPNLSTLNRGEITREVVNCKEILEQAVGARISMFCYPGGRYNRNVIRELRRAGYDGARTTRMFSTHWKFPPFEMPTTVQAFPHSKVECLRNLVRAPNLHRLFTYASQGRGHRNWVALGQRFFDQVLQDGGIWHLYGHSWEIDSRNLWDDLREMLDYVQGRIGVVYLTNGELTRLLQGKHEIHAPRFVEQL